MTDDPLVFVLVMVLFTGALVIGHWGFGWF